MKITVKELLDRWNWILIRNCPGQFVLRSHNPSISFEELLGPDYQVQNFCSSLAQDPVLVVELKDGGLITYASSDGSLLHTLNTEEGVQLKLTQLEITLSLLIENV
ncbi:MAG: hypothetical protein NPIRA02_20830 [Nitrospirales bacterium]|nr:MAG: hypothetical protein NPIRA02_20830 [Nitrospirales bacterium]